MEIFATGTWCCGGIQQIVSLLAIFISLLKDTSSQYESYPVHRMWLNIKKWEIFDIFVFMWEEALALIISNNCDHQMLISWSVSVHTDRQIVQSK